MSYRFDKTEVPQFDREPGCTSDKVECVACHECEGRDRQTGLCRPCWRVVILGPAMANRDLP